MDRHLRVHPRPDRVAHHTQTVRHALIQNVGRLLHLLRLIGQGGLEMVLPACSAARQSSAIEEYSSIVPPSSNRPDQHHVDDIGQDP